MWPFKKKPAELCSQPPPTGMSSSHLSQDSPTAPPVKWEKLNSLVCIHPCNILYESLPSSKITNQQPMGFIELLYVSCGPQSQNTKLIASFYKSRDYTSKFRFLIYLGKHELWQHAAPVPTQHPSARISPHLPL